MIAAGFAVNKDTYGPFGCQNWENNMWLQIKPTEALLYLYREFRCSKFGATCLQNSCVSVVTAKHIVTMRYMFHTPYFDNHSESFLCLRILATNTSQASTLLVHWGTVRTLREQTTWYCIIVLREVMQSADDARGDFGTNRITDDYA